MNVHPTANLPFHNQPPLLQVMGNLRLGKDGGSLVSCQEVMTLLEVASLTPERSMSENAAIIHAFNVLERESDFCSKPVLNREDVA